MDILQFKDISYTHEVLEDIYLNVLEIIPEAILVINQDFKIIVFNSRAELLFGHSKEEVINESIINLINFGDRLKYLNMLKNYIIDPFFSEKMIDFKFITILTKFNRDIKLIVKMNSFIITDAGVHVLLLFRRE